MNEFNNGAMVMESETALTLIRDQKQVCQQYGAYVGLDVHKDSIAVAIAWRVQKRLCGRYRTLIQAGKHQKVVCVAIARELVAFIWDIVCLEMSKLQWQS